MARQRINPKRPQTKKEKYKKEAQTRNAKGRARAIAELGQDDVIYMLGEDPTYIHSREVYYKAGRATAIKLLNNGLTKTVSQVHAEIDRLTPLLDAEVNNIVRALNMNSWEEFQQWWSHEVQPNSPDLATNNEALYYLSLLEKIKKQATSIGAYLSMRQSGRSGKGEAMTQAGAKQLIAAGFVQAGFTGAKGEQAGANAAITQIRAQQRQDMSTLAKWLVPILEKMNTKTADHIITQLKKIAGPNLDGVGGKVDATYATEIGQIFEYVSDLFSRELESGIKVQMNNIAAEKTGKNSKQYKADTKHTVTIGSVQFSFLSSDKTGMETVFGQGSGQAIGYIDKFTAGIESPHLKLVGSNIETIVDWNLVDPQLDNLFAYIVRNADYFGRQDEEAKTIIVSFFAWAKLITELVGMQSSIADMPVVIRMFNRLYKTSDIMRRFSNISGVSIMQYVNKTYLYDYYKTFQATGKMDKKLLREIKGNAMSEMRGGVTYSALKNAISSTLQGVNSQVTRQNYFHTNLRILLGNIENLKELM